MLLSAGLDRASAHVGDAEVRDPVCGMPVERPEDSLSLEYDGRRYFFCSRTCGATFESDPARYAEAAAAPVMAGIPPSFFAAGAAVILLASFFAMELLTRRRRTERMLKTSRNAWRLNFLAWKPLKRLVAWRPLQFVVQLPFVIALLVIMVAGVFGNPEPRHNIATMLTWTVWWAGLVFVVLLVGNAWCMVCPWDAIASWVQRVSLWRRRRDGDLVTLGRPWPRALSNVYPALALLLGITWLELGFEMTMKPAATAALAGLMVMLAVVSALVFERKAFCRYACLVGRMCGLYALFAPLELRAAEVGPCRTCRPPRCMEGNDRGYACPTGVHPAVVRDQAYCTMCTECVKTCPYDNVAINLRPFGAGLVRPMSVGTDEGWLAGALLAVVIFHGLTMTPSWETLIGSIMQTTGAPQIAAFTFAMAVGIALPLAIVRAATWVSLRLSGASRFPLGALFARHCFALLPVALFYHLAHNSMHFFMEVPRVMVVLSDPLGHGWNLFGTASLSPGPMLSMPTVWGLQVGAIIIGHLYSLAAAHALGLRLFPERGVRLRAQIPFLFLMIGLSTMSLWLVSQPMLMRTAL